MISILDNFVAKVKADYKENFKTKLLVQLSFYSILFFLFFTLSFFIIQYKIGSLLMLIGAFSHFVLVRLFILKRLNYNSTFKTGLYITFILLLINIYLTGGIKSHSMPWLLLIPILSNLILENKRSNLFWALLSSIAIFIFSILSFKTTNHIPLDARTYVNFSSYTGYMVMLLLLTSMFEKKKKHFYKELILKDIELKENLELKQTRDSLKENQERWKFAIEGSNAGMWDYNFETGEVYRSSRWAEIIGFKKEEISNSIDEWKDRIHPDDKERVEEILNKHFNHEIESYVSEHRMLCKDGHYKWVLDRGKVIAWMENGKPKRVVGTKTDITKRKIAEEELKQNQGKLQAIFEGSNDAILLLTDKGFFDCNPKALEMFNISSRKDITSIHPSDISPEFQPDGQNSLEKANEMIKIAYEKGMNRFEWEHKRFGGENFPAEVLLSAFYYGNEMVLQSTVQDITERKVSEVKIKQSLAEKEVLLKEVHHRVKNNLQIISSILNLQSSTISDEHTLELLKNSQDRIRSMSLIHELLYQTKDFSTIKFSEYIESIATNLFHSYNQNKNISLDLDLDDIHLDLDMAIPCGLIVNELLTNSLKYAFETEDNGKISIQLKNEGVFVQLSIKDNGKGFPKDIDFRDTASLGMQLVVSLVDQIDGEVILNTDNGSEYKITFKAPTLII